MKPKFSDFARQYREELLDNVMPFWLNNSLDKEFGGYFTCLDREGNVFDKDKFVWLQGREVWMFATMYNKVEKKKEWLDAAILGGEFLKNFGHDGNYNFYFSLTQEGKPLIEPYNIFSNTFATMAFAQLGEATGNKEYLEIAKKTFEQTLKRRSNPKGKWAKGVAGTRPMKDFALPMILCNLTLDIESLVDPKLKNELIDECINEVMDVFYQEDLGLIVENLSIDNELVNSFEGRVMNPGHSLEAMWFIMDLGVRLNRKSLIEKAVKIALNTIEYGWDKEYGGIFYFLDRLGCPPQQLEWDQKLWWVHIESMITMLKGYQLTGSEECLSWFTRLHDYVWTHFKDEEHGEWFGYLNRRGEVSLSLKGGKWKGCFHVPRGLYQCWKTLEDLSK